MVARAGFLVVLGAVTSCATSASEYLPHSGLVEQNFYNIGPQGDGRLTKRLVAYHSDRFSILIDAHNVADWAPGIGLDFLGKDSNCSVFQALRVGQVLEMNEEDLLCVRNFGVKGLQELSGLLQSRGFLPKPYGDGWERS